MTDRDRRFYALLAERLGPRFTYLGDALYRDYGLTPIRRRRPIATFGVHHSAGGETAAAVCRYHASKWDTPGYHTFVRRDGRVEGIAPPDALITYGAGPFNNPTCAYVCCAGNYQEDQPTPAMLASLYTVLCAMDDAYGGKPWRAHRELPRAATACCGVNLLAHLRRMRGGQYGAAVPRPAVYP